jgi:hypothetical protein
MRSRRVVTTTAERRAAQTQPQREDRTERRKIKKFSQWMLQDLPIMSYEAIHILKQLAGAYSTVLPTALHTATRMLSSPVGEFHSDEAFGPSTSSSGGGLVIVCYGFGVVEYLKHRV